MSDATEPRPDDVRDALPADHDAPCRPAGHHIPAPLHSDRYSRSTHPHRNAHTDSTTPRTANP